MRPVPAMRRGFCGRKLLKTNGITACIAPASGGRISDARISGDAQVMRGVVQVIENTGRIMMRITPASPPRITPLSIGGDAVMRRWKWEKRIAKMARRGKRVPAPRLTIF